MPELPEVETVVGGLKKTVLGQTIDSVRISSPKIKKAEAEFMISRLPGCTFLDIRRRGKNILIELTDDLTLWVHLKMTGHFYFLPRETRIEKHDLVVFFLKDSKYTLRFNDYRRFGNFRLLPTADLPARKELAELGSEPLEITLPEFIGLFRGTRRMIKPALLDQTFLAGLGNIYADESLYLARIHPRRLTDSISPRKLAELHRIIKSVLKRAIKNMGTSVDTFAGVNGEPGGYQKYLKVYGRDGERCRRCGGIIRREKIGSRSAHYCPRCQHL